MDSKQSDVNETPTEETYSVEVQASDVVHSDVEEDEVNEPLTTLQEPEPEHTSENKVVECSAECQCGEDCECAPECLCVTNEVEELKEKEYPIEHYYHKYIHIKDRVNNMIRNMQYDRSRTVHLLLCVVEMVDKIGEFTNDKKRELTLYIMNKLISKWNIYLRLDKNVLFELLSHIYDYLVKVADGEIYVKEPPSNFEYEEPNVITYSLFEKFDKKPNGNKFELMNTVLLLLNEVQKYRSTLV